MKTKVVSFYMGPCAGKSALAWELAAYLKRQKLSVELVCEWVKTWAWEGRIPQGVSDNLYILAKQLKAEKTVYGKVDYIITDSPIGNPAIYEKIYNPETDSVRYMVRELLRLQKLEGKVERINLLLERKHPYIQEGRFQSFEKAQKVDEMCREFLLDYGYQTVSDLESALKAIGL